MVYDRPEVIGEGAIFTDGSVECRFTISLVFTYKEQN